jgi:hypothetical protein
VREVLGDVMSEVPFLLRSLKYGWQSFWYDREVKKLANEWRKKMGEEELIAEWTEKLAQELEETGVHISSPEWEAIQRIVHKVFLVGVETGMDNEKLKRQLEQLGKPHGTD